MAYCRVAEVERLELAIQGVAVCTCGRFDCDGTPWQKEFIRGVRSACRAYAEWLYGLKRYSVFTMKLYGLTSTGVTAAFLGVFPPDGEVQS